VNWVGSRQPFHVTAPGKLFLAELGSRELEEFIERSLERYTDATITDGVQLRSALDVVRQVGYATTYEEREIGLVAVAMPVRDMGNAIVATVTISGPAFRVNVDSIPKLLPPLQETTARISWRLGHIKRG
jgi:DNA-binding IclR family transcriptional regulator